MQDYAFYFLNPKQQKMYHLLRKALFQYEQTIPASGIDAAEMNTVLKAVLTDTPDLFWFEGKWKYETAGDTRYIHPLYTVDIAETQRIRSRLEEISSDFMKSNKSISELDRVRYAYDWILSNVDYGLSEGTGQTIYDAFLKRKAVCKGLSKGFQYLLKRMHCFSTLQEGTLDGAGKHIWNIVEINGKYYNVDVSMGYDCFSDLFDDSRKFDKYRCFAVPDDQLSEFHRIYHLPWPSLPCSHSLEDRVK